MQRKKPDAPPPPEASTSTCSSSPDDRVIRTQEFARLLGGVHVETLYAWRANPPDGLPRLPVPVQVGPHTIGYLMSEVQAFIRALPRSAPPRRGPKRKGNP